MAPLASEAPEFIIATIFASRGKGDIAIATLISAKVNQWTLLIGSLPVAFMLGGGGAAMQLDGRQIEEIVLTAAQTLMGVALLLGLRFRRWTAWALLGLFVVHSAHLDRGTTAAQRGVRGDRGGGAGASIGGSCRPTLSAPFAGRAKRHGGHPHPPPEQVHP